MITNKINWILKIILENNKQNKYLHGNQLKVNLYKIKTFLIIINTPIVIMIIKNQPEVKYIKDILK